MTACGIRPTRESFCGPQEDGQLIASFGNARLVKKTDGQIELVGGTAEDYADACDWCSLLAHDVVFTWLPQGIHPVDFAAQDSPLNSRYAV
jgi:hypothetical protein